MSVFFQNLQAVAATGSPTIRAKLLLILLRLTDNWRFQVLQPNSMIGRRMSTDHMTQDEIVKQIDHQQVYLTESLEAVVSRLDGAQTADDVMTNTFRSTRFLDEALASVDPDHVELRRRVEKINWSLWMTAAFEQLTDRANIRMAIDAFRSAAQYATYDPFAGMISRRLSRETVVLGVEQRLGPNIRGTTPSQSMSCDELRLMIAKIEALRMEVYIFQGVAHRLDRLRRQTGSLLASSLVRENKLAEAANVYHDYVIGENIHFNSDETITYLSFLEKWLLATSTTSRLLHILDHIAKIRDEHLFNQAIAMTRRIINDRRRTYHSSASLPIRDIISQLDKLAGQPWNVRALPSNVTPIRKETK